MKPMGLYTVHPNYLINVKQVKTFDYTKSEFITQSGNSVPTGDSELEDLMRELESGKLQTT